MYYLSSRQRLREREQNRVEFNKFNNVIFLFNINLEKVENRTQEDNINTNNLQNITVVTNNLPTRAENEINNNYTIRYNNNFMNVGGATWTDLCQHGCGYYHLTSATKSIT